MRCVSEHRRSASLVCWRNRQGLHDASRQVNMDDQSGMEFEDLSLAEIDLFILAELRSFTGEH